MSVLRHVSNSWFRLAKNEMRKNGDLDRLSNMLKKGLKPGIAYRIVKARAKKLEEMYGSCDQAIMPKPIEKSKVESIQEAA